MVGKGRGRATVTCREQSPGWGWRLVRVQGGRLQDAPRVLLPRGTPPALPVTPSHILLVLARVSSCCLEFLNPLSLLPAFPGC